MLEQTDIKHIRRSKNKQQLTLMLMLLVETTTDQTNIKHNVHVHFKTTLVNSNRFERDLYNHKVLLSQSN